MHLIIFSKLLLGFKDFLLFVHVHSKTRSQHDVDYLEHQQAYPHTSNNVEVSTDQVLSCRKAACLVYSNISIL